MATVTSPFLCEHWMGQQACAHIEYVSVCALVMGGYIIA